MYKIRYFEKTDFDYKGIVEIDNTIFQIFL